MLILLHWNRPLDCGIFCQIEQYSYLFILYYHFTCFITVCSSFCSLFIVLSSNSYPAMNFTSESLALGYFLKDIYKTLRFTYSHTVKYHNAQIMITFIIQMCKKNHKIVIFLHTILNLLLQSLYPDIQNLGAMYKSLNRKENHKRNICHKYCSLLQEL